VPGDRVIVEEIRDVHTLRGGEVDAQVMPQSAESAVTDSFQGSSDDAQTFAHWCRSVI
jgi:hypothetical protein